MIRIIESSAIKVAGTTSIKVSFNYNPEIVDAVKSVGDGVWNKKLSVWEFPIGKLADVIDCLTFYDDIEVVPAEEEIKYKVSQQCEHKIKPFEYQSEGIDWLINNNSGLLLDPPGLGKTLQVIYAAEELKKQKGIKHCLIICGVNSLKQNWKKEIHKFSNESVRVIGEKIAKTGKVSYASVRDRAKELYDPIDAFFIIINIESFRESLIIDAIKNSKNNFDMIVCDEIHKCSPSSQQGKNFLKLSSIGTYRFGLTGTLLTNSPLNAYAPLKFIGKEKACFSAFKSYYCVMSQQFGHYQIDGYRNLTHLKDELDECSIRRSKDLLNLPPKTIINEVIELDSSQKKFYTDLQNGILGEIDLVHMRTTSLLGMVVRLRQAVSCPEVLTSAKISNAKIDRCCELVDEILSNNEKIVIFSTFKQPLLNLYELLKKYNPLLCTGDQPDIEVSNNIDKFQTDDSYKIMLCTTQKLGVGVTLTAASYEIFIDAPWVPAEFEQCCDRCWRIGSNKPVIIYSLVAKGTIDERVQEVLETKKAISDYIVDDKLDNAKSDVLHLLGVDENLID